MTENLTVLSPPNNKPPTRTTTDFSDDIRELGEKIVALTIFEAKELSDYLETILG